MKTPSIRITKDAEDDLFDIYDYIARHDSVAQANYVLDKLESLIYSLEKIPNRGHVPPELDRIGVKEFKELHYKPYRVIYQIIDGDAVIHACLDGRRDMQILLERRLTR
ncbi:MAG: type II toxin-antitoxin system RelE/ParE family toxin [Gammaproteobacteria bacterium]|nr:type II toxin-antitoxin system RelE/ParE family toxin [Gammaproteobacteria bacterium]